MTKKSIIIVIAVVVLGYGGLVFSGDNWKTDWKMSLKEAAANNQPVLIDFYTDWCPPCKKLNKTTFVDPKMNEFFRKEKYVLVKVNPEKDRVAESKFKVYSYPTLVLFNGKGKEIDRILGYRTTAQLIEALENLKKGIGTLEDLLAQQKKVAGQKTDENFKLMFKILEKYTARADYPQGLELIGKIIELDKDNGKKQASAAMFQRGYIFYKWKKYKEAVEALTSIHQVYPESEEAVGGFSAAAYYSTKLDDPALTLKIYKKLVKKYPDNKAAEYAAKQIVKLEKKLKDK